MSRNESQIPGAAAYVANVAANRLVNRTVDGAYRGAISAALSPAQFALDIAITGATAITTYLIMTTGRLVIGGVCLVAEGTAKGVSYLFSNPAAEIKSTSNEWDFAEENDGPLAPKTP